MSKTIPSKLSFGILCSCFEFQEWQAQCIERLLEHDQVELTLLICEKNATTISPPQNIFSKFRHYPYKTLLFRVWNRFFFSVPSRNRCSLKEKLKGCATIFCQTEQKIYAHYFSEKDVKTIRTHQLDFILRFGFGIIRGDILEAAKYGIWSFHHGDEQKYRGGPAGFWEIFNDDPVSGAILQRLTNKLDGGIILHKGFFKTISHSYPTNFNQLLKHTVEWPLIVCKKIMNGAAISETPCETNAKIYKVPGNFKMLGFFFKVVRNKLQFHLINLFRAEEWNIGIVDSEIHDLFEKPMQNSPVFFPKPKRGTYLADPFGYYENGKLKIVCEDYSYNDQTGSIAKIDFESNSKETILTSNHHLSYPYVIKHEGRIYCVPESFENGKIEIFELTGALKPKSMKTLVDNTEAVDPTLFKHNGFWWLFFSPKEPSNTELCIYYSENIFGNFQPHLLNPVKTDIRSSRPAGSPYVHKDRLFRPGQNCSETYGGSVVLNEVLELSPSVYSEIKISELHPFPDCEYTAGIHTVAKIGTQTLVDSKRNLFLWSHFKIQWIIKFKKMLTRAN